MATKVGNKYFVPIGCSCMTQFQLNFKFGVSRYDSMLFDWNIVTPDSTIEIFRSPNKPLINTIDDLRIMNDSRVASTILPGFYWWHLSKLVERPDELSIHNKDDLSPQFNALREKTTHQVRKLFRITETPTFVWCNAQPNLKSAIPYLLDQLVLTKTRYTDLKDSILESYPDANFKFVVRRDLVQKTILGASDIFTLDLPYSDDFKGPTGLFEAIWAKHRT